MSLRSRRRRAVHPSLFLAAIVVAAVLAACGTGAGETGRDKVAGPRTDTPNSATSEVPPGSVPGDTSGASSGGSSGGGASLSPGPSATGPAAATPVVPQPGQKNVNVVTVSALTAQVAGGRLLATAGWESGPAPCHVLDRIETGRQDNTFSVKLFEGGPSDVVCPAIVVAKTTQIDLGPVGPGNYDVVALVPDGSSAPLPRASVVVP